MEVIWQDLARTQFQGVLQYVRDEFGDLVTQGIAFKLLKKIDSLGDMPNMARVVDEVDGYVIRKLVFKKSVIFYTECNNQIYILSIFDTRMSPKTMRGIIQNEINKLNITF